MHRSTLAAFYFVSACASQHERSETTDASAEDPHAAEVSACDACTDVEAARSVDAQVPGAVDAGSPLRDASLARGTPGDGICKLKPVTCTVETVDVRGTSPWGELHIRQIGLNYWAGFQDGTGVFARGEVNGAAIELYASPVPVSADTATPPGEYRVLPDNSPPPWLRARYDDCAGSTDLNATLRIERNDDPPRTLVSEWPGMPAHFEGVLMLSEPGWSLTLPLSISKICDAWVDI